MFLQKTVKHYLQKTIKHYLPFNSVKGLLKVPVETEANRIGGGYCRFNLFKICGNTQRDNVLGEEVGVTMCNPEVDIAFSRPFRYRQLIPSHTVTQ